MTEQLYNRKREPHTANFTVGKKAAPARRFLGPCKRCGGSGHYSHNGEHSRCYRCIESGRNPNSEVYVENLYTLAQLDKMDATAAKKAARKLAKEAAAREAKAIADEAARVARREMLAADPVFALLTKYADRNEFVAEMLGKLRVRDLSDAQLSAAQAACDRIAKADAEREVSQYVGEVGARIQLDAVVVVSKCIYHADASGWRGGRPDANRYLLKMKDGAGNVLVWFTASAWKEGARLVGTATVKEHNTRDGVAQTIIKNYRAAKRPAETEGDE